MSRHRWLDLLQDRIDLRHVPFTERGSRLIVLQDDDGLQVASAEYETPLARSVVVRSLRFVAGDGAPPLDSHVISYPDHLCFGAGGGTVRLLFQDPETILLTLPSGASGVRFRPAVPLTPATGSTHATATPGPRDGACLQYATNAGLRVERTHGDEVLLELDAADGDVLALRVSAGRGRPLRDLPTAAAALTAAQRRWSDWFAKAPPVRGDLLEQYAFAWWVLGINLLRMRFDPAIEGLVPSKLGYVGVWHWDAYFHAVALRHVDLRLAQDQIRLLLRHQLPDGMIPDVIHDGGVLSSAAHMVPRDRSNSLRYVGEGSALGNRMMQAPITKPPLTAWAAWKVHEAAPDLDFLLEVYHPTVRNQAWWTRSNDLDANGLCEYLHPYSSGIDDGPLWDQGPPVESPDLNSYLVLQYDHLAKMADALGIEHDARRWRDAADALTKRLLDARWDPEAGLFWATRHGRRIETRTPFNLYPLLTGRLPRAVADGLVRTLTDPQQFWGRYAVPTAAFDDPAFDPERMWRGPIWLNPNYMLVEGLLRSGYPEVAAALRGKTLALITDHPNDMNEYHHPLTGSKPPRATVLFGWTAALFIDLAITETRAGAHAPTVLQKDV